MADKERTSARDLDRELRGLGSRIEYPPTPDQARQIRRRIEQNGEGAERRNAAWPPTLSPKWISAAAVLLLLLVAPLLSSGVRDGLSGLFTPGWGAGGAAQSGGSEVASEQASDQGAGDAAQGSAAESQGAAGSSAGVAAEDGSFDRKVIKTARLGVRSENVRESAEEAQRIVAQLGGNVSNSRVDRGGTVYADLTLTVPAGEFEVALEELRGLGRRVTTDAVRGRDVTEEFVDLESRERNLLAAEESLLELYSESEDVEDTLSIQRELTNVRGEIERVQGRIQYLEQRSDTSRINLSIEPVEEATVFPGWSPASTVSQAWDASLGVLQVIATALLSVAVFSWWLVPVILLGLVWWRTHARRSGDEASEPPNS